MHSLSVMRSPFPALRRAGFSLVEVALAIAIVSVAVVGILSLMSTGLGSYRAVMDTTICAQIAQRILNDAEQADFKTLTDYKNTKGEPAGFTFRAPTKADPALRYFDEQGNEIYPTGKSGTLSSAQRTQAVYWVNTRVMPRAAVPRTDGKATSTAWQKAAGTWDTNDGGTIAQITVEIACNPMGVDLKFVSASESTTSNLFDLTKTPGVRVLTYSGAISRNE